MRRLLRPSAGAALLGQILLLFALPPTGVAEDSREETPEREPLHVVEPEESKSPTLGYLLTGVGILSGVALAVLLKDRGDEAYDRYLHTADPDLARSYLEAAERYDRRSLAGWAVAQVSFVAFFVLLVKDRDHPRVPVEGEPVVRSTEDGLQFGWRLGP
jgi:hypothetical protein